MPHDQHHTHVVQKQFGEQANAYLSSAVHAQAPNSPCCRPNWPGRALRACWTWAAVPVMSVSTWPRWSRKWWPTTCRSRCSTWSPPPLPIAAWPTSHRQGAAERLPFADGEFDFVFSRYSAHHWSDLGLALREVRRVLKPGGVAAFIDVMSPGSPLLDTYLQTVEVLRDTSHVRDYSAAEWLRQVSEAGLHVRSTRASACAWNTHLGRAHAHPGTMRVAIRQLQQPWARKCAIITIEADGSFSTDVLVLWAER
jgi:SAM-dependent methyltransferase